MTTYPNGSSTNAISASVQGHDPISQAGVVSQLRERPEVRVVDDVDDARVDTVVDDAAVVTAAEERNGHSATLCLTDS